MLAVKPGPTFLDAARSFKAELSNWDRTLDRVADLFLRLRTQDAEVAATVFFSAQDLARTTGTAPSEIEIFQDVKRWKQRRRPPLEESEIAQAIRHLNMLRWLTARHSPELPLTEDALIEA
jgi:hypothetical protein